MWGVSGWGAPCGGSVVGVPCVQCEYFSAPENILTKSVQSNTHVQSRPGVYGTKLMLEFQFEYRFKLGFQVEYLILWESVQYSENIFISWSPSSPGIIWFCILCSILYFKLYIVQLNSFHNCKLHSLMFCCETAVDFRYTSCLSGPLLLRILLLNRQ